MVFCFKEHLQWVVCDAPNRPPENPHPGRTLRLPGVRLHQVRLTSLFDQKSLSDGNIFLYSQSPCLASVCFDPLCNSHPPFQELHELSQSPREKISSASKTLPTISVQSIPLKSRPRGVERSAGNFFGQLELLE